MQQLEDEGVAKFDVAWNDLLGTVADRLADKEAQAK